MELRFTDTVDQGKASDLLLNRRAALHTATAGMAASWASREMRVLANEAEPAVPGLIIHNRRPFDAETPVEAFDRWLTPNDLFFVRSHFGAPAVGLHPWTLRVGGLVERPEELDLEDLGRFERVAIPAVLQCAGNGRSFYSPRIAGVGWGRGAVGNAEWAGVRLKDLLEGAGLKAGAAHVHLIGADAPPNVKTPAFLRSIPIERALDPSTLVATHMNGEPLPPLHGGPLRLIVPTWTGNHWMKWLAEVTVAVEEAAGFYQQVGYRIPRTPAPPDAQVPPADLIPVKMMNVKSLIARPSSGEELQAGKHEVRGVAWTGAGRVVRVEISIDSGQWALTELEGPDIEGSWRTWRFTFNARPGDHSVRARATDSSNQTQPESLPWNKSGYLWNGIDEVRFRVVGA